LSALSFGPIKTIAATGLSWFCACASRPQWKGMCEAIQGDLGEIVMELNTKVGVGFVALFVLAAASLSPALARATCLSVRQIRDTRVRDVSTIDFQMRDRRVFRNTLAAPCNQLRFSAFGYHARSGQICDRQAIRLAQGGTCILGNFTLLPPESPKGGQ
jgi:hypothetical protein